MAATFRHFGSTRKGTHWDTKAETVTLAKDDEGKKTKTYEEGQFHFLPQPESPDKLMSKNHIDPILALAKFQDGKEDPGASAMTETAKLTVISSLKTQL